jgi:hypothetical protein
MWKILFKASKLDQILQFRKIDIRVLCLLGVCAAIFPGYANGAATSDTKHDIAHLVPVEGSQNSNPSWETTYYFGRVQLLDLVAPVKELQTSLSRVADDSTLIDEIPALTHTFLLQNKTGKPISIDSVESDCGCTRPDFRDAAFRGLPYIISSGEQVNVTVTLDPRLVQSGQILHYITLKTKDQPTPLAVLKMKGFIDNGIQIIDGETMVDVVEFQPLLQGATQLKKVVLQIDKRLPGYLKSGTKLRLVSTSPDIIPKLLSQSSKTSLLAKQDVKIDDDTFTFASGNEDLGADVRMVYFLEAGPFATLGKFDTEIVLATSQPGIYGMHRHMFFPATGNVIKAQDLKIVK